MGQRASGTYVLWVGSGRKVREGIELSYDRQWRARSWKALLAKLVPLKVNLKFRVSHQWALHGEVILLSMPFGRIALTTLWRMHWEKSPKAGRRELGVPFHTEAEKEGRRRRLEEVGKNRGRSDRIQWLVGSWGWWLSESKSGLTFRSLVLTSGGIMATEQKGRRGDWGGHLVLDLLTMPETSSWKLYL